MECARVSGIAGAGAGAGQSEGPTPERVNVK